MKTDKTGRHMLNLAGKFARHEAVKAGTKWPPCIGFLHQPKRPVKR